MKRAFLMICHEGFLVQFIVLGLLQIRQCASCSYNQENLGRGHPVVLK
jgi:hypothetical protein